MEQLELRIPSLPPGAAGRVADLLKDWLAGTTAFPDLVDLRVRADGLEAVATLERGLRRTEVRFHHEVDDRWLLDAATQVHETEPGATRAWAVLAGLVMFLLGFVVSLRWLSYGAAPFLVGVGVAVILALLVGGMTWRRHTDRKVTAATRVHGGQAVAHDLVDAIAGVAGGDPRVVEMRPL